MRASDHFVAVIRWFDSDFSKKNSIDSSQAVDWLRSIPFIIMHLATIGVFWVGWSPIALFTALIFYLVRMFFITGFYHRYFSHRTFQTSRAIQFLFALLALTAVQRGPLWWAAHHRHHHLHADKENDIHSPEKHGFWWAHIGWIISKKNFATNYTLVPDLAKYPELLFLNRFDLLVPLLFALFIFITGSFLKQIAPQLGTSGPQMLIWGFFISTVVLFHATCTINSLAHLIGKQRFETGDNSKNSLLLALLTLGEGWHNNHHYYQSASRQGFFWWEIDITYYLLKMMSWMGIIWKILPIPNLIFTYKRNRELF